MTIALRLRPEAEQDLADAACPDSSLSVWSLLSGRKHRNCCCSSNAWQQESTSLEEPHITGKYANIAPSEDFARIKQAEIDDEHAG